MNRYERHLEPGATLDDFVRVVLTVSAQLRILGEREAARGALEAFGLRTCRTSDFMPDGEETAARMWTVPCCAVWEPSRPFQENQDKILEIFQSFIPGFEISEFARILSAFRVRIKRRARRNHAKKPSVYRQLREQHIRNKNLS